MLLEQAFIHPQYPEPNPARASSSTRHPWNRPADELSEAKARLLEEAQTTASKFLHPNSDSQIIDFTQTLGSIHQQQEEAQQAWVHHFHYANGTYMTYDQQQEEAQQAWVQPVQYANGTNMTYNPLLPYSPGFYEWLRKVAPERRTHPIQYIYGTNMTYDPRLPNDPGFYEWLRKVAPQTKTHPIQYAHGTGTTHAPRSPDYPTFYEWLQKGAHGKRRRRDLEMRHQN